MRLKGPHGQLTRVLVSKRHKFEDYDDVTSMTSQRHMTSSVSSPIDMP